MPFLKPIVRFLSPIKQDPFIFLRAAIQWFVWAIQWVIHVYFIQRIISLVWAKDWVWMQITLLYYIIYIVVHELLEYISKDWWWIEAIPKTRWLLSRRFIPVFLKIDNNSVESIGTGKLVSIIEKWIDTWAEWLYGIFERWFSFIVIFVYVLYQLIINRLEYALIFIVITIVLIILAYFINEKTVIERNKKNEFKSLFTKHLVKVIMSKFEILQSNKTEKEVSQLEYYTHQTYLLNKSQGTYLHPYFRIPEFLLALSKLCICYFIGTKVIDGTLPFSSFVGIITSLILMDKALDNFLKLYKDFTKDYPSIENFWNFFDNSPHIKWYETGKVFAHSSGKIEIQHLNFSYHSWNPLFNNFSLEIKGEKITALVWPSGWGKTTLAKLISWYICPTWWEIKVDNQSLSKVSLKSYYKDIGYLTQDPSVFDGTVLENLTYAIDKKLPKESIEEAIKLACCEFIYTLPKWIKTPIGERGVKLSGGQKQRLAIAKIILKNPKIIILDEPTSALDSFSEEKITEALNNLFIWRTVIVIAHRLQTVKHADEIIVIESWEIKERGTHNSLIKKWGYYKKMLDLQSGF